MYYDWEWLSDIAIIPAWEIFLAGLVVGACIGVLITLLTGK